jgi:hypothetical protein
MPGLTAATSRGIGFARRARRASLPPRRREESSARLMTYAPEIKGCLADIACDLPATKVICCSIYGEKLSPENFPLRTADYR